MNTARLADCPGRANYVSTQATDETRRMRPFSFSGSAEQAILRLKRAIAKLPRTRIVSEEDDYLHAEVASRLFRFVDDLEFVVDGAAGEIHFRSASRSGYYDFGVNRARINHLREAFIRETE